jgi:hypothetical protein
VLGPLRRNVLTRPQVRLCDGSELAWIREETDRRRGPEKLVRIISYTFTDPRFPQAGQRVYRLVTTLLDPFLYPAKDLAVLYHERWHVEQVIDETRCDLRLCEQTLRSRTPQGVEQELYALLLVHVLVRTLMLRAAQAQDIAPVRLSFTETLCILDEHLTPLALAPAARRPRLFDAMVREIGQQRLPTQPLRIQARVLKRSHARYAHKKPEHWHVVPFQVDLDFHEVIALVV